MVDEHYKRGNNGAPCTQPNTATFKTTSYTRGLSLYLLVIKMNVVVSPASITI